MKNTLLFVTILSMSFMGFIGCNEQPGNLNSNPDTTEYDTVSGLHTDEVFYDDYILSIDNNDSLTYGKSLYYSKSDGASTEAAFYADESNSMVKLVEFYTQKSNSISKNIFYFKDGKKFASKEIFEDGEGDQIKYVERLTYYGDDEKPIVTKQRSAMFEEELDFESYNIATKHDCSTKRALDILNQSGEFATYFKGFIKEEAFTYLIVGGKEKGSYSSSLIVQHVSPTIIKLQEDQEAMLGMSLIVDFEVVFDPAEGFEYQILKSVNLR